MPARVVTPLIIFTSMVTQIVDGYSWPMDAEHGFLFLEIRDAEVVNTEVYLNILRGRKQGCQLPFAAES